ncbi:PDZ domain-containing RING finger protein 4 [Platysternon megacephalum]|uniref:PDZ domain-containing RING finger protein 4 n=1 Tax=Platysternon megacephalum TaxID=55544 RepID=A0A4D9E3Y2_9SAUR|nr:PDZ domain-containing RING finger protein 4 [Platysternon megacephalum]
MRSVDTDMKENIEVECRGSQWSGEAREHGDLLTWICSLTCVHTANLQGLDRRLSRTWALSPLPLNGILGLGPEYLLTQIRLTCTLKEAGHRLKPERILGLVCRLLYLGREYPKGADYFRSRLKAAFLKNKDVKDPEKIKQLISRGEFVIKELEALYYLRKYRAMKQRYYEDDNKNK